MTVMIAHDAEAVLIRPKVSARGVKGKDGHVMSERSSPVPWTAGSRSTCARCTHKPRKARISTPVAAKYSVADSELPTVRRIAVNARKLKATISAEYGKTFALSRDPRGSIRFEIRVS
jgi:hypothetical protein